MKVLNWWTVPVPILIDTRMVNNKVKTKYPTVKRILLSRKSVVAMIRGVYCPPATWMATSRELKVNTIKERFVVTIVSSSDRAPAISRP